MPLTMSVDSLELSVSGLKNKLQLLMQRTEGCKAPVLTAVSNNKLWKSNSRPIYTPSCITLAPTSLVQGQTVAYLTVGQAEDVAGDGGLQGPTLDRRVKQRADKSCSGSWASLIPLNTGRLQELPQRTESCQVEFFTVVTDNNLESFTWRPIWHIPLLTAHTWTHNSAHCCSPVISDLMRLPLELA